VSYSKLPGVKDTVVGYCGGTSPDNPTYKEIGDFTEALRVEFDPNVITFEELLRIFWEEHSPMPRAFTGTQYRSAIFCHTEEQRLVADRLRQELRPSISKHTDLESAGDFFRAEEYHQHFITKQSSRMMI